MITKDFSKQSNPRQSNFELLRIIAMLFIIFHHLGIHANYSTATLASWKGGFVNFYISLGKIGVNLFVFISGYFLVTGKFSWKKLLKLELQILFYSLGIYAIFVLSGVEKFDAFELVKCFFPLVFEEYWFMTAYVITYLLSPLLNYAINKLSAKALLIITMLLITIQVPISTIITIKYLSYVLWFLTLYMLASYLRLHYDNFRNNPYWILATLCFVSTITVVLYCTKKYPLFDDCSGICLTFAFLIFILFRKINIGNIKWINVVAQGTLGVYLIHDNLSIRAWIWNDFLKCPMHGESDLYPLFALLAVSAIFVTCVAIDLARRYLLERPIFSLIHKAKSKKAQNNSDNIE